MHTDGVGLEGGFIGVYGGLTCYVMEVLIIVVGLKVLQGV